MSLLDRIETSFMDSIAVKQAALSELQNPIALAAQLITHSLLAGGKIICCGNGGSASASQHFASLMMNGFEMERPGLPTVSLTTDTAVLSSIANDNSYDQIFSRQISALGNNEDVLIAISTSGNSGNMVNAIEAAHDRGLQVVALTGKSGGEMAARLCSDDIEIRVPADSAAHIHEIHILVIHCLCDLIDHQLIGQ